MNLHSGTPFWLVKNGLVSARPPLSSNETCDVAIVGAGVTGALVAHALTVEGLETVIIDAHESGGGSTAASTALLQYEIDLELLQLSDKIGRTGAERAYLASSSAVASVVRLGSDLGDCDVVTRASLYLATTRGDASRLQKEAAARAAIGLEVEWWTASRVRETYGFPSHGAIRSAQAAEIDALAFTRRLLDASVHAGARLYEQTKLAAYESRNGGVHLRTACGHSIEARLMICATGYDVPAFFKQERASLHSSYALATERLSGFGSWHDQCLVWESARPYAYMRTTADGRIIIGGEDVRFQNPARRDRMLPRKTRRLERTLAALLPGLETSTAFEWTGTFAETDDGLPYIGPDLRYPGVLFALGYGGNGITFSAIAAELLTALSLGHSHMDADLFRMDR